MFMLKINCLYINLTILVTCYIHFTCVFKYNYIKMYMRNRLDVLQEVKLATYNLHMGLYI